MKLTPTQVYNKLVHLQILTGSTMRQSNIFAVKHTWHYYNNQSEFLVQFTMTVYLIYQLRTQFSTAVKTNFHGVFTDLELAKQQVDICNRDVGTTSWTITPIELTTDSFMESVLTKDQHDYLHCYGN